MPQTDRNPSKNGHSQKKDDFQTSIDLIQSNIQQLAQQIYFSQTIAYLKDTSTFSKERGLSFSKVKRQEIIIKSDAPPVGTYQTQNTKNFLPGPGTYDVSTLYSSRLPKQPSFTLGSKHKISSLLINNKPDIPDPGHYDPISMRQDGRYVHSKKQIVGPGAYEADNQKIMRCLSNFRNRERTIFPISKRLTLGDVSKETKLVPGPGEYILPSDFGNYKYQFIQRMQIKKKQQNLNSSSLVKNDAYMDQQQEK
ncbi:UNKNOWN [Stylonychia lemnae]|uniref:Uncharacterized protein n=1 Tax=Stylonychia lemnae TaxID=5949 RepID=A0A077ZYJ0_STYLE|nr:UNKNOWN [Stylonychia lemnae]|eukprot:CDW75011.1 UNKNOWN [Stylonychia lemnae]